MNEEINALITLLKGLTIDLNTNNNEIKVSAPLYGIPQINSQCRKQMLSLYELLLELSER